MKRSYKNPALCWHTRREEEQSGCQAAIVLHNVIKNLPRSQYFRNIAIRAIQDACFLLFVVVCIRLVGAGFSWLFQLLGVA